MSLLSIVVLTYNQETMVTKCLDSILTSSTENIELIIADDDSPDSTGEVIEEWIQNNKYQFHRVKFIKNPSNMGTVKNLQNAMVNIQTPYIKTIAGDDWFVDGAIDVLSDFINRNANSFDVAFCSMQVAIQDHDGNINITQEIIPASREKNFFSVSAKERFRYLTRWCCLPAPGNLFTKHYWDVIDMSTASINIAEDWYMWLAGAAHEMQFKEIPYTLVIYRKHEKSVSRDIANPRTRQGLSDLSWVLWNVGFSRIDFLGYKDKTRLFILWLTITIASRCSPQMIYFLDQLRRKIGPYIYKRNFD